MQAVPSLALRRLPKVTVQGFKSNCPPTVNEFHEAYG